MTGVKEKTFDPQFLWVEGPNLLPIYLINFSELSPDMFIFLELVDDNRIFYFQFGRGLLKDVIDC